MKKETGFFYNPVSIFRGKVALWEFDSLHCVKKGVWHLRKNLVVFYPSEYQKTQEFPGFFGGASFLHYPSGAGSLSRTAMPSLAADFESATSTNSIIPAYRSIIIQTGQNSKGFFFESEENISPNVTVQPSPRRAGACPAGRRGRACQSLAERQRSAGTGCSPPAAERKARHAARA